MLKKKIYDFPPLCFNKTLAILLVSYGSVSQKAVKSEENTKVLQKWKKNLVSRTVVMRTVFLKLMFASHGSIILMSAHNNLSFIFLPGRAFI